MQDLANSLMLALIVLLLVGCVLRKDRLLTALFLIGFTQIGEAYPFLGSIRFELVVGVLVIFSIVLSGESLARLGTVDNPIARQFYLFVLVVLLSVPLAVSVSDSMYWVEYYFKRCFILYLGAVALLDSEKKIKSLINMYLVCILWLGFCAIYNYLSGNIVMVNGVQRVRGATGLLNNPNGLANTLVGALPVAYYLLFVYWRKFWKAWAIAIVCIVSVSAIFMSGSRGGFMGLLTALFSSVLLAKKRSTAVVVVAVVLLICMAFVGPELLGRYASILDNINPTSHGGNRWAGLRHGVSMLIKRPILGVGIGCYPVARYQWFGWSLWAHNTYGQLMGELGILGILAWGFLLYYTIRGARSIRTMVEELRDREKGKYLYYLSLGIEVATYARLVLGMTTHSVHIYFWYLNAGLVVCMHRIIEQMRSEENEGSR